MIRLLSIFFCAIPFVLFAQISGEWPDSLNIISKSLCVVEYFQPQYESGDIKSEAKIKRKISGFLVSKDGLVMTPDDIFPASLDITSSDPVYAFMQRPPENITVSFDREKKLKAQFVGKDQSLHIAFLQIDEPANLPPAVKFYNSSNQKIGDRFFIIDHLSNVYENEIIITAQHINSIIEKPQKLYLTTNNYTPLSAGGLALLSDGKPFGIVFKRNDRPVFHDFSVDDYAQSTILTRILPYSYFAELIKNPPTLSSQKNGGGKSWLGIQMQILTNDMAEFWKLKNTNGIIINSIVPRSPAETAGLKVGDIITSIGDLQIKSEDKNNLDIFRNYIRMQPEGEINIQFIRDSKTINKKIILTTAPKSQFLADEFSEEKLGVSVKELTQDIILNYDLDFDTQGVWVSRIEDAGAASLGGLELNDLILSVNDRPVKNLENFKNQIKMLNKDNRKYCQFFIMRRSKTKFLFIKNPFQN